jgi:choline-sulfatase
VRGHRSLYYFLRPDEPHLFQYLKRNGYDVYWYGKNDLLAPEAFSGSVTEWGPRPARAKGPGNPWPFEDPRYYSFLYNAGGDRRDTGDWAQVEAAIRVLRRAEEPLHLPASQHGASPFTAPKDFHDMYDRAGARCGPRPARQAGFP